MTQTGSPISTLTRKRIFQIAIVYIGFAWAVTEMVGFSHREAFDGTVQAQAL